MSSREVRPVSQDLSVAGKRAGLAGERSGLFYEQIRVTKEMRDADIKRGRTGELIRPRYLIWENVAGALSSNRGADFGVVLTETVRAAEPDAPDVPVPAKGWPKCGCLYDELGRWSVAWRVHDAQYWGVPQRRKRIALLADFNGLSAGEILFDAQLRREAAGADAEPSVGHTGRSAGPEVHPLAESLPGDSEPGKPSGKETSGGAGGGAYPPIANTLTARHDGSPQPEKGNGANIVVQERSHAYLLRMREGRDGGGKGPLVQEDASGTLGTGNDQVLIRPTYCPQGNCIDRAETAGCNGKGWCEDVSYTLNTIDRPAVMAFALNAGSSCHETEVSKTLESDEPKLSSNQGGVAVIQSAGFSFGQSAEARSIGWQEEVSPTVRGGEGGNQKPCVYDARGNGDGETCCTLTGDHQNRVTDYTALCVGKWTYRDVTGTLSPGAHPGGCNGQDAYNDMLVVDTKQSGCLTPWETQARRVYGEDGVAPTLNSRENSGMNQQSVFFKTATVRRMTPIESERLQGFPSGWTDIGDWTDSKGKAHQTSDNARYKALGNSIALPFWQWLLRRIAAQYERQATLGSLFDGISGFPLCWERCGGKAVWSSEVEEFCIAVAKRHFGED